VSARDAESEGHTAYILGSSPKEEARSEMYERAAVSERTSNSPLARPGADLLRRVSEMVRSCLSVSNSSRWLSDLLNAGGSSCSCSSFEAAAAEPRATDGLLEDGSLASSRFASSSSAQMRCRRATASASSGACDPPSIASRLRGPCQASQA
jgi:hypothetical protein